MKVLTMKYYEFANGDTRYLKSLGHALQYAHDNNTKVVR